MADFIDWAALSKASESPSYEGIRNVLTKPRASYTETAGKAISPLLQPGVDPYLQEAINEIVRQGKESKARTLADVTTAALSRGLTGSSIESGDIAQASTQAELGQQGQVTNLLAQDAAAKKQQMVQFLTQAYAMDFQQANALADNLAQLMGQELGRQTQEKMFGQAQRAAERNQPGFLEQIAPSVISIAPKLLGL